MFATEYLNMFRRTVVWSQDLKDPALRERYALSGFKWMCRADPKHFNQIVRQPTVGFYVELYVSRHPGCISLDSVKAKEILKRNCYFTNDILWR